LAEILLSYRTEERATAEALSRHLADAGHAVHLGTRFAHHDPTDDEIQKNEDEIDHSACVVTLWSRAAAGSANVLIEARRAASQHKLIIADLQGVPVPPSIADRELVDISGWLLTREPRELHPLEAAIRTLRERLSETAKPVPPDIYLAYGRQDEADAGAVYDALDRAGYDVWWDRKIALGSVWRAQIGTAFTGAKLFVLLATRETLKSPFVRAYLDLAAQRGKPFLLAELEQLSPGDYPISLGRKRRIELKWWRTTRNPAELKLLSDAVEIMIGSPTKTKPPARGTPLRPADKGVPRAGNDVFVSYKQQERPRIAPYVQQLTGAGLQVWWDGLINAGTNWNDAIEKALKESRSVAVFWTQMSVLSEEVRSEAEYGMRIGALFPVLLETCEIPIRMLRIQHLDLTRANPIHTFDDYILSIKKRVSPR
jgi:hypothetical protein